MNLYLRFRIDPSKADILYIHSSKALLTEGLSYVMKNLPEDREGEVILSLEN